MSRLTMAQFEALRAIDSPTVANAIERFEIRPRTEGYAGYDLRCQFPSLGTMMGYAVTCTADSTTEGRLESARADAAVGGARGGAEAGRGRHQGCRHRSAPRAATWAR